MQHFVFLEKNRDISTALPVSYDSALVIFSVLIAIFASYTAFLVAERISAHRQTGRRMVWIIAGSMALGAGVWAMHFIGMLAASLPVTVSYDVLTTLVSFFPVFIASMVLFVNGLKSQTRARQLLIRSIAIGGGIGLMHYIGMLAMKMDAIMRFDPVIVLLSVAAAVILAWMSLKTKLWAEEEDHIETVRHPRLVAATIMGCAISSMHYIGMAAVYFFSSVEPSADAAGMAPDVLAQIVGIIILSVLALLIGVVYISKRLELLAKLKISEERLRAIMDNVVEAVITMDNHGVVQNFNSGAEQVFGFTAEEVLGRNINMLMPDSVASEHDGYLQRYRETGKRTIVGSTRTVTARHKDNYSIIIELSVTELELGGQQLFTGVLRDVTDKVRAEAELENYRERLEELVEERTRELELARDDALEATRAKSEFLANMSHELRTPLNSIIGFTGIVKDGVAGPLNEEQEKQLGMVYNSAGHLLELINDILDLSKVEAGKMEVYREDVDLPLLLSDVVSMIQPQADAKQLGLIVDIEDLPGIFNTDGKMLRQVLVNLLGNAVKFTDQGEVELTSSVKDGCLRIDVRDTGSGIGQDDLTHIFDTFRQLDSGDNRMKEGSGLGLAISQKFVEMLGGTLTVNSVEGEGSVFSICFEEKQRIASNLGAETDAVEQVYVPVGPDTEKLVLIVDDESNARELLDTHLRRDGYRTIMCDNGADVVALARENRPYAITLDILMPGMDGWDVLAALKKDPHTSGIPVIIVSTLDDERLGMSLGAMDYLQKPLDADHLLDVLDGFSLVGNHVLVVEDHEEDALLLKKVLEPAGFNVIHCSTGVEALEVIEKQVPNVILLDLMMPGMSGFEVIRRLRNGDQSMENIPVIVISAKTLTDAERSYLNDNVTRVLVKGQFDRDSMLQQVRKAIGSLQSQEG